MKNLSNSIMRFIKNKNTITIIGVIVIVGLLYFAYTTTVNTQVKPTSIPVAKVTIQPRTLITEDMVDYIEVPGATISENVVRISKNIIGKYSNYNTVIPEGSMFYSGILIDAKDMPDSAFVDVKEGEIPYQFAVDMKTTYGNSIFPGNKIDVYMKAINSEGQVMVGKLLENVEVLAVKDNNGNHVFENTEESRTPAYLIFGVSDEIHLLLRKAEYLYAYSVELFPVPYGSKTPTEDGTKVSTQYLKDFINANTVNLPTEVETPENGE